MNPNFIYSRITQPNLEAAWIEAMPWIDKAIDQVNHDHAELYYIQDNLKKGLLQLWAIQDKTKGNQPVFFLITELHVIGGFKTLILRWAAGRDMKSWINEIELLEHIAANEGYHKVEIWGRPGWERALKEFGYRKEFVIVSKIIQRGMN